ncbi:MAG: chromate efflux transporter [Hyphomonas sp.]|uniref:chromate efflux transporter n=1 Tax=Hyphomonas sp. TaxID=87 RepID=UPI0035295484
MTDTIVPAPAPSLAELTAASFKVGCLGFGGPAGQIALMHRVFVEEKKWIANEDYLHALNYCMLLPGPEAQQLATYAGWRLRGVAGGMIAGLLFVAPGALLVFALAWLYAALGEVPLVAALFLGVKAAVVAFVLDALVRIGRRTLKDPLDLLVAGAAFLALYLFNLPFPLVILGAGMVGILVSGGAAERPAPQGRFDAGKAFRAATLWGTLWLAPLAASFVLLGPDHVLTRVGLLFSKLAVVTFGGAYAVLAYLQQQAVNAEGWLSAGQMIDGLGLAETTPGPLVLVNEFVGFMAGWNAEGGGLGFALATAAMAAWCTFAPSFVWIFAGAPFAERLRHSVRAKGALGAITSAVLGVIATLAVLFSVNVLFDRQADAALPWGHSLHLPDLASANLLAMVIAAAAAVALIRYRVNVVAVVLACGAAGLIQLL